MEETRHMNPVICDSAKKLDEVSILSRKSEALNTTNIPDDIAQLSDVLWSLASFRVEENLSILEQARDALIQITNDILSILQEIMQDSIDFLDQFADDLSTWDFFESKFDFCDHNSKITLRVPSHQKIENQPFFTFDRTSQILNTVIGILALLVTVLVWIDSKTPSEYEIHSMQYQEESLELERRKAEALERIANHLLKNPDQDISLLRQQLESHLNEAESSRQNAYSDSDNQNADALNQGEDS